MRFPNRLLFRMLAMCSVLLAAGLAGCIWYLGSLGISPGALAHFVESRSAGSGAKAQAARLAQRPLTLLAAPRVDSMDTLALTIGASGKPASAPQPAGRVVSVADAPQLRQAIAAALPGDVITLAAGTYRVAGDSIGVRAAATTASPIIVRSATPGSAMIEFDTVEGFAVSAPHWRFENLSIRGVCADHARCEHAFHVVGAARGFAAINNTIVDFNAHFKINGAGGRFPDRGTIEGNTLSNGTPRRTSNSVTPIDLVAASDWTIRRNLIADFIKQGGDQVSYGGFAKGGGKQNVFEQNIVWCERRLQGEPGQRVGLSLGGGGSAPAYCRDRACVTEQERGVIRANLIVACSDDGIYVNSAARSVVAHNTLVATNGISVRYPTSSAELEGNLVDGAIRARNDGILHLRDNLESSTALQYLAQRPLRELLATGRGGAFSWTGAAPRRAPRSRAAADLCGAARPDAPVYGAFEDFAACVDPQARAPGS